MGKIISIIVAIDKNNGIGKNNDLLVYIPGDLKRFKEITSGHPVIMGRKTFESLPNGPLPNRKNIVITGTEMKIEGAIVVHSIDDALDHCPENEECFVIGGGLVYKQFLNIADRLYLTIVDQGFDADTFFPELNFSDWNLVHEEVFNRGEKADFKFSYKDFRRKLKS